MTRPLDAVFRPESIALVGGSRDPTSMGGLLLRNVRASHRGVLYWVNRRAAEEGEPGAYASVRDVDGPIDLAIVAVPARDVLTVVRDAIDRGARGIVMITAGFAELGDATHDDSSALRELVRARGVRLVGPNCLGVVSTDPDRPLNASFGPADPPAGTVAVATQSGALGFVFLEHLRRRGLGLVELVSVGNKLDLNESDFLERWREVPEARVVSLYLESIAEPRRFLAAVRDLRRTRPVVVLKTGRTAVGQRAAGSHTAALATPARLVDGLLRQAGALRVDSLAELFDVTTLVAQQTPPRGRRAAIVTNAGGPGVMATDAFAEQGWSVPEFSPALQARLREVLASLAAVRNPVDLVGTIDATLYARCVELVAESGEVDAILPIYVPRVPGTSRAIAEAVANVARRSPDAGPTFAAVFMESEDELERVQVRSRPAPCYAFPEAAVRALAAAAEMRRPVAAPREAASSAGLAFDAARVTAAFAAARPRVSPDGWLAVEDVQQVLAACGLATPAWRWLPARSSGSIAARLAELRYPLVLKAVVPGVLHKRAAGALALDVRDADDAARRCGEFAARFPNLQGVFVQESRPGDHELLVGVQRDPQFGHVLALGPGGSDVERRAERLPFRLLPYEADERLDQAREALPDADPALRDAAVEFAERVATLVAVAPQIEELDVNPAAWRADERRLVALDARIRVASADA